MHRGYIKLWRKLFDSKMHRNHKLYVLWTWLLGNVTHKEMVYFEGNKHITLMPGQIVTGRKRLADELSMGVQSVRTILHSLEKLGNLTIKSTNRYSIITIVNWNTYQSDEEKSTNKLTNNQPATNQQLTTKQEQKNVRTKEIIILPDFLDPEVWKEFKKYRQNGKTKFTEYAQKLAINKLTKLKAEGNDPNEVIKQSILMGWLGLFPLKKDFDKKYKDGWEELDEWAKQEEVDRISKK
jgi:hypothetical protein